MTIFDRRTHVLKFLLHTSVCSLLAINFNVFVYRGELKLKCTNVQLNFTET